MWDKKIYICAPYTAYSDDPEWATVEGNVEKYVKAVANAMESGHVVLSWIYNHLTTKMGLTPDHDAKWYLDQDKVLLSCADEVWACGPHNISSGMQEEIAHAQSLFIPVRYVYKEKHSLEPCPWCGSIPTLYWKNGTIYHHDAGYFAECIDSSCHCMPRAYSSSLQETVRRWNARSETNE